MARELAAPADDIKAIFGLAECHHDPNVAVYGLENVLFPVGTDFIEIVAPTRDGTAAGRFLDRHGGRHGYMLIMDCEDPARRQAHCATLGARTANLIRHEGYLGVQLHPKDTGGAMLEFNHTTGGEDPRGPYGPAGGRWQDAIRQEVVRRMLAAQIDCPDPEEFSGRWGKLLERPVRPSGDGKFRIALDSGAIEFHPADRADAVLAGLELEVVSRDQVLRAARARGRVDENGEIVVCGVRIQIKEGA